MKPTDPAGRGTEEANARPVLGDEQEVTCPRVLQVQRHPVQCCVSSGHGLAVGLQWEETLLDRWVSESSVVHRGSGGCDSLDLLVLYQA